MLSNPLDLCKRSLCVMEPPLNFYREFLTDAILELWERHTALEDRFLKVFTGFYLSRPQGFSLLVCTFTWRYVALLR